MSHAIHLFDAEFCGALNKEQRVSFFDFLARAEPGYAGKNVGKHNNNHNYADGDSPVEFSNISERMRRKQQWRWRDSASASESRCGADRHHYRRTEWRRDCEPGLNDHWLHSSTTPSMTARPAHLLRGTWRLFWWRRTSPSRRLPWPVATPVPSPAKAFSPNIPSGTLVWSDEFNNTTGAIAQPNPQIWTYDTGTDCCGNNELETYCAWGDSTNGCSKTSPSEYVGISDGYLHIEAQEPQTSPAVYTSARLKTQGLFSFQYGRLEVSAMIPEAQGFWPAIWLLGNNITTINWPGCGELDVMEHIDGNDPPPYVGGTPPGYDWIAGSVHGGTSSNEISGSLTYHPSGFSAAAWHSYGMIWSPQSVSYYVDDYTKPYITFTPTNSSFNSSNWPFDQGPQFIILNLAIGGDWPGPPDSHYSLPVRDA